MRLFYLIMLIMYYILDESTQGNGQTIGTCSQLPSSNLCCQSDGSCSGTTYYNSGTMTTETCTA